MRAPQPRCSADATAAPSCTRGDVARCMHGGQAAGGEQLRRCARNARESGGSGGGARRAPSASTAPWKRLLGRACAVASLSHSLSSLRPWIIGPCPPALWAPPQRSSGPRRQPPPTSCRAARRLASEQEARPGTVTTARWAASTAPCSRARATADRREAQECSCRRIMQARCAAQAAKGAATHAALRQTPTAARRSPVPP